jgi:hypothetical protein
LPEKQKRRIATRRKKFFITGEGKYGVTVKLQRWLAGWQSIGKIIHLILKEP